MYILEYKEKPVAVLFVKLNERENYVKECVACAALAFADLDSTLSADYSVIDVVTATIIVIDGNRTVNPCLLYTSDAADE